MPRGLFWGAAQSLLRFRLLQHTLELESESILGIELEQLVYILQAGRIFVLFQVVESEIAQSHFLLRIVVAVIPDEFKRFGVVFTGLFFGLAAVEDPELSSIEGTLVLRGLRFHVLCEDLVTGVNVLLTFGGISRLVLGSNINVSQTGTFGSVGVVAVQRPIRGGGGDCSRGSLRRLACWSEATPPCGDSHRP